MLSLNVADLSKPSTAHSATSHVEGEQSFLSRHFETLAKDPNRDPRAAFRTPATAASATASSGDGISSANPDEANGASLGEVHAAEAHAACRPVKRKSPRRQSGFAVATPLIATFPFLIQIQPSAVTRRTRQGPVGQA